MPFSNYTITVLTRDTFRLIAAVSTPAPPAPPRPVNASLPSVNFSSIPGIYNNRGYGSFELCSVFANSTTASSSCKALASNVSIILPGAVDPSGNIPTFLTEWNSPWGSHLKLTHWNENVFNISLLASYVSTYVPLSARFCFRSLTAW
jgi:hypothetical protein